jgi:hypothetical protein
MPTETVLVIIGVGAVFGLFSLVLAWASRSY